MDTEDNKDEQKWNWPKAIAEVIGCLAVVAVVWIVCGRG